MSALLDVLEEARELYETAKLERTRALVRASKAGHSLRVVAKAGGISFNGLRYILAKAERDGIE